MMSAIRLQYKKKDKHKILYLIIKTVSLFILKNKINTLLFTFLFKLLNYIRN